MYGRKIRSVLLPAIGFALACVASSAGSAQDALTTADGVFTAEQAESAQATYDSRCASCHGNNLGGGASAPPLSGFPFTSYWAGKTLADLSTVLHTMPADNPGSLSDEQYLDLAALILNANGYPAGDTELTLETDLTAIAITAPEEGGAEAGQ